MIAVTIVVLLLAVYTEEMWNCDCSEIINLDRNEFLEKVLPLVSWKVLEISCLQINKVEVIYGDRANSASFLFSFIYDSK